MACVFVKTENAHIIMCGFPDYTSRFLFWFFELKKYTGVNWFYNYPEIYWHTILQTFRENPLTFWRYVHMWAYWGEKNFLPGERNPLWWWFSIQWKLKKLWKL